MKILALIFLLALNITVLGQVENQDQSITSIERIFKYYLKQNESTDSKDNKIEMELSLKSLQMSCDAKHFTKLIDVWMYYDPPDFPTRQLIKPILLLDKGAALKSIEKRIKRKKKWETQGTAPYFDLLQLKDEFKNI